MTVDEKPREEVQHMDTMDVKETSSYGDDLGDLQTILANSNIPRWSGSSITIYRE
jgi:hypothetical protein